MRGFVIGRFQPFHNGHLQLVETILSETNELVIGIGSADQSHTTKNPFTAGERIEMTTATLRHTNPTTTIVPIPDIPSNATWVSYTTSLCPRFDTVYANNPLVIQLFHEAGYPVTETKLYQRETYQGTEIRRRMRTDEPWEDLVPTPTVDVIKDLDGIDRIQTISTTDERP